MAINRRDFLQGAAGVSGATLAGSGLSKHLFARGTQYLPPLPPPDQSPIQNIVVVMMENRSFDHMLGWMSNARGRQGGLVYTDKNGVKQKTYRLTSFTECPHPDPDFIYPVLDCTTGPG